jgi:hypothetical protein
MLSKKHLEALKAQRKRRAQRPIAGSLSSQKPKLSDSAERRMMREHADLLQNIEFVLVANYREQDDVDDYVVEKALQAAIRRIAPQEPAVQSILQQLDDIRELRRDASDELWADALRVVVSSVRSHSSCRAGVTHYLNFVSQFIV